jgi:predicted nuclease with RNAse H fold
VLTEQFRRTELALRRRGLLPKSVFQIGGWGAVGTGSIRGMPLLLRLREAGAAIWPFDPPGWPLVLEIYPRLLTGPVVKSRPAARQAYVARWYPNLAEWSIASEDAFDAAVSALVMARHADNLAALPSEPDHELRLEGRIWYPDWDTDVT